jgi:hypothetical protein
VVFPGNPGNARYYEKFMRTLHDKFEGKADIVAVSHLGHDPDSPYKGQVSQSISRHRRQAPQAHQVVPGWYQVMTARNQGHSAPCMLSL